MNFVCKDGFRSVSLFVVFIFISVIYYFPSYLFSKIAIKQSVNKVFFLKKNSEINRSQHFILSLIYILLIGEIGYNLCSTYLELKNGLVDDDVIFFLLILIIPIIDQFLSSFVFLPKYWNPHIRGIDRRVLLIAFFVSNLFYSFKIVNLDLNNVHNMGALFFIFLALPALPSYFVLLVIVAKESKQAEYSYRDTNKFKIEIRTKEIACLILLYVVILLSQNALIFFHRTNLGVSPKHALSISNDDLLTNEKYILGEDNNNNQIRDDYELWVQKNYADQDERMAMLQYGQSHFRFMNTTLTGLKNIKGLKELEFYNFEDKDSELIDYYSGKHIFWSGACIDYIFKKDGMELEDLWAIRKKADAVLINNRDRYNVDKRGNFSGGGFNIPDYEGCNFIMKKSDNKDEIAFKNLRNIIIHSIEKGDSEKAKIYCSKVHDRKLEDYMIEEISTTALLKQNVNILNVLYDCGINFRKRDYNNIYSDSSLKWLNSKYK